MNGGLLARLRKGPGAPKKNRSFDRLHERPAAKAQPPRTRIEDVAPGGAGLFGVFESPPPPCVCALYTKSLYNK